MPCTHMQEELEALKEENEAEEDLFDQVRAPVGGGYRWRYVCLLIGVVDGWLAVVAAVLGARHLVVPIGKVSVTERLS